MRCFLAVFLLCETASPVCTVDPAALCVFVRLHVILPLFRPEISTYFHCSTLKSGAIHPILPHISEPHIC